MEPSYYAAVTNVIWDVQYTHINNFNTDPTSITDNINAMIAASQTIKSADGIVPVISVKQG